MAFIIYKLIVKQSVRYLAHSLPDTLRNQAPQESQDPELPVNDHDTAPAQNSIDSSLTYRHLVHNHRIFLVIVEDVSADKSRADIGKVNVYLAHPRKLGQCVM